MDPYKILGTPKDATASEIQRAYRQKARKHHPDAGGDAWAFQQVQQAYEEIMRARSNQASKAPASSKPPASAKSPTSAKPERPRSSQANAKQQTGKNRQSNSAKTSGTKSSNWRNRPKQLEGKASHLEKVAAKVPYWLRHLFTGELPLQNEVTVFILVGVLDIFMTYILLRFGAVEANPFARPFLQRWGFNGLIFFKMMSITFVTVLAQVTAQYRMSSGRKILTYGTAIVGIVVIYSIMLLAQQRL